MEDAGDERNNFSGEEYEEEFEEIEVEEEVEEEIEEEDIGPGGEQNGGVVAKVDSGAGAEEKRPVNNFDSAASEGKIFVGGVAWETTEEIFTKHFKKYGEIIDSVIMKDKHTRMPRGFGFVTFSDPSVLDEVLKDEHVIDGRSVEVKRTVPRENMMSRGDGPKTKKIFVGGIPPSLTEDEFKEYFAAYGKVAEHQIMLDHSTGRSRGFGFITFESEDSVEEIMADERTHELGGKQVELKRAVPKKAGGESSFGGRGSYGPPGSVNMYGSYGGGGYGYGDGHRSGASYGGRATPGVYGRGYGYGGGYGYGMGFGPAYGGLYGYGAGYGGQGGYGAFYGAGGAAYGGQGGRYGSRYNPYGR